MTTEEHGAEGPLDAAGLQDRWALVLPHAARLRRVAARRLASRDEVDDVVQEAMLRAVTFERLDPDYAGAFLTSVTVRLCADVQRERVRQLRAGVRDALSTVEPHDPHEDVLDLEEARWLYAECLKLPPRQAAVMLARAQGLSIREAAGSLGLGTKTAEAALTQARCRIRRSVQAAGSLVALLRRGRRVAAMSAVAAASAGVLATGGIPDLLERRLPPPRIEAAAPAVTFTPPEVVRTGPRRTGAADPARVVTVEARPATVSPRSRVRPPHPSFQRNTIFKTGPIGDPDTVGTDGGIETETTHPEQSFEESLMECIRNGIGGGKYLLCDDGGKS